MGVFRTGVSEVRLTFFGTDSKNRPLGTISKDDFAIVDGETVIRDYRSLTRSNENKLDVVVMVDTSDSMGPRLQSAMTQVLKLISQNSPALDDHLSVLSFAGLQPAVLCTRDCGSSAHKLLAVKAAGPTPLYDALKYGSHFSVAEPSPSLRRVLILFSDGNDTVSKISSSDALRAVIDSGAVLYAIDFSGNDRDSGGSAMLQHMAEATGGRYFSDTESATGVLQAALEDLRSSYVVTYQLPAPVRGFHSVRILPKHDLNLRFHCRNGYYYGTSIQ